MANKYSNFITNKTMYLLATIFESLSVVAVIFCAFMAIKCFNPKNNK